MHFCVCFAVERFVSTGESCLNYAIFFFCSLQHLLSVCPNYYVYGFCFLHFPSVCVRFQLPSSDDVCNFLHERFSLPICHKIHFHFPGFHFRWRWTQSGWSCFPLSLIFTIFTISISASLSFFLYHFSLFHSFSSHFYSISHFHMQPMLILYHIVFLPLRIRSHFVQYNPQIMLLFYFKKIVSLFVRFFFVFLHLLWFVYLFSFFARFGLEVPSDFAMRKSLLWFIYFANAPHTIQLVRAAFSTKNWSFLPWLFSAFGSLLFDSLCVSFKHRNL